MQILQIAVDNMIDVSKYIVYRLEALEKVSKAQMLNTQYNETHQRRRKQNIHSFKAGL